MIDHNGEYSPDVTYNGGEREWLPDEADIAGVGAWSDQTTRRRIAQTAAQLHTTRVQVAHVADYLTAVPTREEYEAVAREVTVLQGIVRNLTAALQDVIALADRAA